MRLPKPSGLWKNTLSHYRFGHHAILLLAKDQGLIPSVKDVLDALIAQGKRISQRLYQESLAIAQE
jgi:hypothetical protein